MFEAKSPGMTWPLRLPRLIHLVDTPSEYGTPGQVLQLDATGRRLEWTTLDFVTEGELATHENTPNAHHDPFIALEDNAGTEVTPAAVDARIQLKTGNSILAIAAGTNIITFTVAQGNIDHGSIAGLGDNDHPHYARKASAETISAIWNFTASSFSVSPGETTVLNITSGRVAITNVGLNVGGTLDPGNGNIWAAGYGAFPGGVRIGSIGDPGDNNLSVAGNATITGNCNVSGTISTDGGSTAWDLGGYTAAPAYPNGYLTVVIGGTTYRLDVQKM